MCPTLFPSKAGSHLGPDAPPPPPPALNHSGPNTHDLVVSMRHRRIALVRSLRRQGLKRLLNQIGLNQIHVGESARTSSCEYMRIRLYVRRWALMRACACACECVAGGRARTCLRMGDDKNHRENNLRVRDRCRAAETWTRVLWFLGRGVLGQRESGRAWSRSEARPAAIVGPGASRGRGTAGSKGCTTDV